MAFALLASISTTHAQDGGGIASINETLCAEMKTHNVLHPGAPIGCARLRLVTFSYVGFDGRVHPDGEIVVLDAVAEHVLRIFARLREVKFPIAKARLINQYEGDDDASIADDNTSAFNDRTVAGSSSLSLHAYGLAIDINPVENPYAKRSAAGLKFSPPAGAAFANRKDNRPGMAESIIDVFADEGFPIWGGRWHDPIDYQHFQVSRRLAEHVARLPPAQAQAAFARSVERYRACRRSTTPASSRSACLARARIN